MFVRSIHTWYCKAISQCNSTQWVFRWLQKQAGWEFVELKRAIALKERAITCCRLLTF